MSQVTAMKRGKSWQYRFECAKVDGQRKRITKGGFRTKAEALAAGTKAKAEYDNSGQIFKAADISVADFMKYWLENYVKVHLAYETYHSYESVIRLHINPQLGMYRLSALTPETVQNWVNHYLMEEKGLSEQSIANFTATLSGALKYAVFPCKYIKESPCIYVKLPKIPPKEEWKEKIDYVCTKKDWKNIQELYYGTDYYCALMLLYHTGMRIGECCGLDLLQDVDFRTHKLSIRRQLRRQDGQWIYKPPKYNSIRTIMMGQTIENALRKEIARRKENALRYGEYYTKTYLDKNLVLYQIPVSVPITEGMTEVWPMVRENGVLLTPETFKLVSRQIKAKLDLPNFHPHSLRHTHGTILAEGGASPKTIMERLGHKNITTTMQRYVFNTDKMQLEACNIFEAAIR